MKIIIIIIIITIKSLPNSAGFSIEYRTKTTAFQFYQ